ncbi:MAG TPA: DUF559 domain-containing protein [Candidatus Dormibacteraeota bacterium]
MQQAVFPLIRLAAVARRLPRGAVFSGRTAAWLHGLDLPPCSPVEVTLPRLSHTSRLAQISVTRSDVAGDEISEIQDLRATSGTRTVADLGRRPPLVEAVVVLDMALHRRIIAIEQLQRWLSVHPGYHGVRQLRQAVELADPAAESPMETRLRLLLVTNGLPTPLVQASLYDDSGMFLARPDLYYPCGNLAIEYDGATHRTTLAADNRRQNRLLEAGYRLLRFTAGDIVRTPAAVVGQVERALARSG